MSRDLSDKLPARITSILTQKKNRGRYSVFIEEGFLIGVDESTLLEFNLAKGVEVTPLLLQKLRKAEGRQGVKSYCLRMLARRDHARKELFDKAIKKGHPSDTVRSVLDELEGKGYLDDRSFARKFAADKSRLNNWGPAKIKSHLYRKGISRQVSEESVQIAFEEVDLGETLAGLVSKKKRRFQREEDEFKRRKKMFDYLRRKGYRSESILKHLDRLMKSVDA